MNVEYIYWEGEEDMSNVTVQARITPELKEEADAVLGALGLSTADAIRIFLQQVVNTGGLPFRPSLKQPNPETLEAIEELDNGGGQMFDSPSELFASWKR